MQLLMPLLIILVLFLSSTCFASGFGIFTQGASALGQADAVVAHGTDPSAIFFNPALISKLKGTHFQLGTTYIQADRKYEGNTETSGSTAYFPGTFYATHNLHDNVSIGLGLFNPFGLGTTWNRNWEGRYLATKSEITTYTINPVVSVRVLPSVSVAVGAEYILLDADLNRHVDLSALGLPDAGQKFSGKGDGWGFNVGLAADITDRLSFGASYRSRIHISLDGDVAFRRPAPGLEAVLPDTKASSSIMLPQQVFTGLSYRITDSFTAEAGVRWEEWSSIHDLKLQFRNPVGGQTSVTEKKKWHDTFAYNLGGSWAMNDTFTLLGGYLYGQNAAPDRTFEPSVPDSNTHLFCIGTELHAGASTIALAYGYQLQNDRRKNNNIGEGIANGTYSSSLHLAGVSVSYAF